MLTKWYTKSISQFSYRCVLPREADIPHQEPMSWPVDIRTQFIINNRADVRSYTRTWAHDTFRARVLTHNARVSKTFQIEVSPTQTSRPPAKQAWALIFSSSSYQSSLIILLFTSLWGLAGPRKEWMLPTTKDADLFQGSSVHESETNVAENGVPRKKRRLSNNVKNGSCKTSPDPLQSELNFHPHKKQKTVLPAEGVENTDSSMAEPQRKANFSAYGNHFHERSPLANNSAKPGQAKKLVIKNFKGEIYAFLWLKRVEIMYKDLLAVLSCKESEK